MIDQPFDVVYIFVHGRLYMASYANANIITTSATPDCAVVSSFAMPVPYGLQAQCRRTIVRLVLAGYGT